MHTLLTAQSYFIFQSSAILLVLIIVISIFATLQNYNISWTCSGCYYQMSGSKVSLQDTTTSILNLERDKTFRFSVYANTNFGPGEVSTITATISRYFGEVQNMRHGVKNYTLTLDWEQPSDVEAKDIKVFMCHCIPWLGKFVFDRFCPKYKMLILVNNYYWFIRSLSNPENRSRAEFHTFLSTLIMFLCLRWRRISLVYDELICVKINAKKVSPYSSQCEKHFISTFSQCLVKAIVRKRVVCIFFLFPYKPTHQIQTLNFQYTNTSERVHESS